MKMFQKLAIVAMLGAGLMVSGTSFGQTVGDSLQITAFCVGVNLDFIKSFTARVVAGGMEEYRKVLASIDVPCFDIRMHPIEAITVVLTERLWDFDLPEGEKLTMWTATDSTGVIGYVWLPRN